MSIKYIDSVMGKTAMSVSLNFNGATKKNLATFEGDYRLTRFFHGSVWDEMRELNKVILRHP